jgi:hypothetical protein
MGLAEPFPAAKRPTFGASDDEIGEKKMGERKMGNLFGIRAIRIIRGFSPSPDS